MGAVSGADFAIRLAITILVSSLFGLGFPLLSALVLDVTLTKAMGFIPIVVVFEYAAIPLGVGMGLPAAFLLITAVSESVAIFFATVELLGVLQRLAWIARFVSGIQRRMEGSRLLRSYGMFALAPAVIFLSVKGCATVVWITGWPKYRAMAIILAGFASISGVVLLSTLGLLRILLPGA